MICGHLVADVVPGAGHRQPGHRRQPDRRRRCSRCRANDRAPEPRSIRAARAVDDGRARGRGPRRSPTSCAASRDRCCAACRSRSRPGEAYGLVGESGCGKSTTAYAAVRYLPTQRADHRRPDPGRRRRHHEDVRRRAAHVPDAPRVDGLPGPGRGAEPVDQGRAAGHRGVHACSARTRTQARSQRARGAASASRSPTRSG